MSEPEWAANSRPLNQPSDALLIMSCRLIIEIKEIFIIILIVLYMEHLMHRCIILYKL